MTSKSDEAVEWLLGRIQRDPRLAYYFDFTESMARLTAAHAEANGLDVEKFRSRYYKSLRFAEPVCRTGVCRRDAERTPLAIQRAAMTEIK